MVFKKKLMVALTFVLLMTTVFCVNMQHSNAQDATNVVFEEGFEGDTSSWYTYSYNGKSKISFSESDAYEGSYSCMISSKSNNDARMIRKINVEPSSYYTVSAYVKTEDVKETSWVVSRLGATISIIGTTFVSKSIEGDSPWTRLTFSFATGIDPDPVELCFTLGGYGKMNSGTAWFDCITVEKVDNYPEDAFALDDTVVITGGNLLENGGFEDDDDCWSMNTYIDSATNFKIDNDVVHSGLKSMCIENMTDNDARIIQNIPVSPNKYYTVTAWAKAQSVPYSTEEKQCYGATISVMDTTYVSDSLHGTTGWIKLTFSFYTAEKQDSVDLCFTLGGYGRMNSGKVWFDDITVEEVATRPDHVFPLQYTGSDKIPASGDSWLPQGYELTDHPDIVKWTAFVFMWFIVIAALALVYTETGDLHDNGKRLSRAFCFIVAIASLGRIIMGMFVPAYTWDYSCWVGWSWRAAADLFNIYRLEDVFIDYPPLYMYVLAPIGVPVSLLWNIMGGSISMLLLKLPSMIADMVSAYLLYKLAEKHLDKRWAVFIAAFYMLNPAIWLNSACWNQIDSLFTMLVLFELYFILEKKWVGTGIMFALMVLLKPHGIIFAPTIGLVLLFEIIKNKNVKPMLIAFGSGVAVCVVVLLPFYIRMGFDDPAWIIKLYMSTVGDQYSYATMNGFNFWAMLGKNNVSASSTILGLTYSQWGMLGVGLAIFLSIWFMVKATRQRMAPQIQKAAPLIVSLVVYVTVFTFAHKMHERYLFAAVALCLCVFIVTRERGFMWLALMFSAVIFINTYYIYNLNVMYVWSHPKPGDKLVMLFGGLEVLSFVMMIVLTVKVAIKNAVSEPPSLKNRTNGEDDREV